MSLFDLDHWREIRNALGSNKLRTLLTAFGVFWGIFMLMVMLGSGNGLHRGVMQGFGDQATNSFVVWTQRTSQPYQGLPPGRALVLTNEDIRAIGRQISDARIVAPRNQLGGYQGGDNVTRGTRSGGFQVMGDVAEYREIERVRIESGRFLHPLDVAERRKVAVIGARVRQVLFGADEDPIGQAIRIRGVYFKVVGVFRSRRSGEQADRDTERIHVPFTTFQRAFHYGNRVDWVAVTSRDGAPASAVESAVVALLKQRHRVAPGDTRAFGSWNTEREYNQVRGLFAGIRALVWIVGLGTLLAGAIGVSNIMLVLVKERTHEIGIRRAVGARPATIVGQIVLEAVLLTVLAGYIGLLGGMGLIDAVAALLPSDGTSRMFAHPDVELSSALEALGILVLAGVAAGAIPAHRAVRIPTVEALRGN